MKIEEIDQVVLIMPDVPSWKNGARELTKSFFPNAKVVFEGAGDLVIQTTIQSDQIVFAAQFDQQELKREAYRISEKPVDSNELSFMLAARHAFSEAFKNAGPKILEPIYDLEVYVPADFMGDVMSDLQGRRALIMGMDSEAGYQKLQAKIPLKELANYSISLSSLTGGRASFTTKFASYELVPNDVQTQLIKDHEAELAAEDE